MHERERIARDLHDNVLQTNFALLLQVCAVAATAAGDAIGQRLDAIVSTAKATLSAGRDKVAGLRARRHAGATVLRITVTFGWRTCVMVISDNGRGIPPEYAGGRTGHWGLAGMRERAALMQARRGSTSTAGTQEPRSACSSGGGKRAIQHNWCQV